MHQMMTLASLLGAVHDVDESFCLLLLTWQAAILGRPAATAAPLQPDCNPVTVTPEVAGGETLGVQCSLVQVQLLVLVLDDVEQLLALQASDSTVSARAPADARQVLPLQITAPIACKGRWHPLSVIDALRESCPDRHSQRAQEAYLGLLCIHTEQLT